MKLLILALAAVAFAEPDSNPLWYNSRYSNLYPYNTFNGLYNYPVTTQYSGYYANQYPFVNQYNRVLGKRDADAESDPATFLTYRQPSTYPYATYPFNTYRTAATTLGNPVFKQGTYHTNLQNVASGVRTPYYGQAQVYQPVYNHYVKRDADSDSDSESFYPGYPYANTYNSFYNGYRYPTASVYSTGYPYRTYANNYYNNGFYY